MCRYLWTNEGWFYLAVLLELSREHPVRNPPT